MERLLSSNHVPQEVVYLGLPATKVSTLHKVVRLLAPPTGRGVQLERPQKVRGVLEVGPHGEDLMNEVLHADDAVLAERRLDEVVGRDGGAVAVDLDEAALVDQLAHGLEVGRAPGDVRLADAEHVDGGLVQLDEDAIVDLAEAEQLEDLADFGGDLVDTADTHHKSQLGLGRDIVATNKKDNIKI